MSLPIMSPTALTIVLLTLCCVALTCAWLAQRRHLRQLTADRSTAGVAEHDGHTDTAAPPDGATTSSVALALLGHELRLPARNLLRQLDELDKDHAAAKLRGDVQHLLMVIDNVLAWSTQDLQGRPAEGSRSWRVCELVSCLRDALDYASPALQPGVRVLLDVAPALPRLWQIDIGAVRQIVTNLLSNALRHTRTGHVVLSVDVLAADPDAAGSAGNADGGLLLTVTDTGPGIGSGQAQRIFDALQQGQRTMPGPDGSTSQVGTAGLGLAVARFLARGMDGDVSLAADYRDGARFVVTLPAARPLTADAAAMSGEPSTANADLRGARIAVCEGDPVAAGILVQLLHQQGATGLLRAPPGDPADTGAIETSGAAAAIVGTEVSAATLQAWRRQCPVLRLKPWRGGRRALHLLDPDAVIEALHACLQAAPRAQPDAAQPDAAQGNIGTVLAVDDHPLARATLDTAIRQAGGLPVLAEDGTQALTRLRELPAPPTWILLDQHMPGGDGVTTAAVLRAALQGADTSIVLLVNDSTETPPAAERLFDAILERPLGARELAQRLARLFGAAPAARARADDVDLDALLRETLLEDLEGLRAADAACDAAAKAHHLHRMRGALRVRPQTQLQQAFSALERAYATSDAVTGAQERLQAALRESDG